jgi:glycosyltransferase involved in cell wall biosynthesis
MTNTSSTPLRITVVTPSYNQAAYVGETMRSVRDQDHPDVEHIVVDGVSTDGSLEVIRQYGDHATIISEPDRNQTDAINKGLRRATGDIVCWLNSDDYFLPGTLSAVAAHFQQHPEEQWVTGDCVIVDQAGRPIQQAVRWYKRALRALPPPFYLGLTNAVTQPATFWRRELHDRLGFLNESLDYTMDYDWWLRLLSVGRPGKINRALAGFRIHDESKSGALYEQMFTEDFSTFRSHNSSSALSTLHKAHNAAILAAYRRIK